MKKVLFVLLSLLLCSCSFESDYYTLNIDDYSITVGYDEVNTLETIFDYDIKDTLQEEETVNDIELKFLGKQFCMIDVSNLESKEISGEEGIISKLSLYLNDVGERTYKINDIELDKSVTSDCEKFEGTLIKKNGYACVIESNESGKLNVIELHGDILADDQDKLDHIVIYVK